MEQVFNWTSNSIVSEEGKVKGPLEKSGRGPGRRRSRWLVVSLW